MSTVGRSTKGSANDDQQGCWDKGNFASHSITNQTHKYLTKYSTFQMSKSDKCRRRVPTNTATYQLARNLRPEWTH